VRFQRRSLREGLLPLSRGLVPEIPLRGSAAPRERDPSDPRDEEETSSSLITSGHVRLLGKSVARINGIEDPGKPFLPGARRYGDDGT
jgi:hypothetical protein